MTYALLAIGSILLMIGLCTAGHSALQRDSEWWALYFVAAFMALVGWVVFLAKAVAGL